MKKLKFLLFCILFSVIEMLHSQSKIDVNTLFVCIPENDYTSLFSNSFIKDTLFVCKENTTKTDTDKYTGKYFIGEFATIEFFQPSEGNNFGDRLNDIGVEFKSRKIGFLDSLKSLKKNQDFMLERVSQNSNTEHYIWYNALKLKENKTNLEFSILEYSVEYLKMLGFSEEERQKTISPIDFNKIIYGNRRYPRKFKSIKSITLEVNELGWNYLKQQASLFNFRFHKKFIQCHDFRIYYKRNKKIPKTILKQIEIHLTDSLPNKTIYITSNITVSISTKIAKLIFKQEVNL